MVIVKYEPEQTKKTKKAENKVHGVLGFLADYPDTSVDVHIVEDEFVAHNAFYYIRDLTTGDSYERSVLKHVPDLCREHDCIVSFQGEPEQ